MYIHVTTFFFSFQLSADFICRKEKEKQEQIIWGGGGLKKDIDFSGNCVGDNKDKMTLKAHYCMGIFKFYI